MGCYFVGLQRVLPILFSVFSLFYAHIAFSDIATGSLVVTSTVLSTCAVVATPLAFGNYSASQVDNTSTLTVTCTIGTGYEVGLTAGAAASATVTTRAMTVALGSDTLSYALYSNSGRTTNWGNIGDSGTISSTAGLTPSLHTVYGRIPANQTGAPVGAYTDTVTVRVQY